MSRPESTRDRMTSVQGTTTQMTSARRGRRIVRAVVWWTRAGACSARRSPGGAAWSLRTGAPAGAARFVIAGTRGTRHRQSRSGWVEWMGRRFDRSCSGTSCACPSCRLRAPSTSTSCSRTSGSWRADGVHRGIVVPQARGAEVAACPGGHRTSPDRAGDWWSSGRPMLRPGHSRRAALEIPALRRGIYGGTGDRPVPQRPHRAAAAGTRAFEDVHELYVHPRTTSIPSTSAGLIRDLEGSPTRRLVDCRHVVPCDPRVRLR
jgi:hypothetical protein